MSKKPVIAVLIVAAGSGTRMELDIPKQYIPIHGKPVLRHVLNLFQQVSNVDYIQCVISKADQRLYENSVKGCSNILPFVMGGQTRQESVFKGLEALRAKSPDIVLIHDAARPCVRLVDIQNIIAKMNEGQKAATLAMPVSETLRKGQNVIPRDGLHLLQTPQAFDFSMIFSYHEKAVTEGFEATDDTSLASHYGEEIAFVTCGRHNLKITTQDDIVMANALLQPKMETRIGQGFDVHAFDDIPATHIRLCGVDIPHNRSLKGHSDADVGLHALTDALFGALADGDIGSHFPPSDQNFKNMDSHVFLDKSVDNLKKRGGKIRHIDITFMCEEPKIGKHREQIVKHLSEHLNLSTSRISVKATTTEKLGFTGRGEGIACQAVVTVELPTDD